MSIRMGQRRRQTKLGEDNVANVTLGTEPNSPLAFALGLEYHHPIMSTLGDPGGRLERERERDKARDSMQIRAGVYIYTYNNYI